MLRVGRGIRDIWIYFKAGHSGYLPFTLSIMNFIVLQHRLFISYVPFLSQYLEKLSTFVIVFFLTYIPLAVLVGYFDFRKGGMMRRQAQPLHPGYHRGSDTPDEGASGLRQRGH